MSNNYQRLFYILKNMDSDVGCPTGYIKVEINGEAAKLQISLNNLLNRQGLIYQLYGLKKDDKQLIYTVICDVQNENGRADVKVNSDIHRVGASKLRLEDINVFAIISRVPNGTPSIKCPLVAYTSGEVLWKRDFEAILKKELLTSNENLEQENQTEEIPNILSGNVLLQDMNGETEVSEEKNFDEILIFGDVENGETGDSQGVENEEKVKLEYLEDSGMEALDNIENTETKVSKDVQTDDLEMLECPDKFESIITNIYNTHKSTVLEQEKSPDAVLADNDILSSVQKNFYDISSIEIDADKLENELSIPNLKEELDKSFESYNPFKMKSKNFKWWKVNSPGYLNNILFRNNIKSYLLFNPKVMLAHYKYRYIIWGIRNDKHLGKEYFLCGVPGVYSIDENPFGNIGSWAQTEGYKPKYGAFGYWIILIDPRTGKLMKVK